MARPPASIAIKYFARSAAPTGRPETGIPKVAKFITAAMRRPRAPQPGRGRWA